MRSRLPPAVVALGVTSFFTDVGSEMIFPLLPAFVASLGAGPAFLGLVEGLADATSSVLKLASGYVAERTPRKKPLVVFGYGIATLARPIMAAATLPWHALAVRVTDRIGKGIRTAPRDMLLAAATSAESSGRTFGFHRAMDNAGAVVGPLVATALLAAGWPLRHVFWAAVVPGAVSLLVVLRVREPSMEPPAPPARDVDGRMPPSLRAYLGIVALFCLGGASDAFLLLRAQTLGISVAAIPTLWTVLNLSKVASSYAGGSLADRIPRPRLIAGGWVVYAIAYLGLAFATEPWHAWVLMPFYGTYYGLTEPAERALLKDLAPPAVLGRAFGWYHFVTGALAVPAGLLAGRLWERFGPAASLGVGASLAAAAAVCMAIWERAYRAAASPP